MSGLKDALHEFDVATVRATLPSARATNLIFREGVTRCRESSVQERVNNSFLQISKNQRVFRFFARKVTVLYQPHRVWRIRRTFMLKDDLQNGSFEFGLQLFGANKIRIDKADRRSTAENLECQRAAEGIA